jgi:hypothetical protein
MEVTRSTGPCYKQYTTVSYKRSKRCYTNYFILASMQWGALMLAGSVTTVTYARKVFTVLAHEGWESKSCGQQKTFSGQDEKKSVLFYFCEIEKMDGKYLLENKILVGCF